jgi:hypothetical protein
MTKTKFSDLPARVRKQYQDSFLQWTYCIMTAIIALTENDDEQQEWNVYLSGAKISFTDQGQSLSDPRFSLGSNLPTFHDDSVTRKGVDGLSTRIEQLLDW